MAEEEKTRYPDLENKTEKEKNGELRNGQFTFSYPVPKSQSGLGYDFIYYKDGRVHGTPGIECMDGLKEKWKNGKFISIMSPPFNDSFYS
jgi:hypothetical protein